MYIHQLPQKKLLPIRANLLRIKSEQLNFLSTSLPSESKLFGADEFGVAESVEEAVAEYL